LRFGSGRHMDMGSGKSEESDRRPCPRNGVVSRTSGYRDPTRGSYLDLYLIIYVVRHCAIENRSLSFLRLDVGGGSSQEQSRVYWEILRFGGSRHDSADSWRETREMMWGSTRATV
jgi:hypothetical protein